MNDYDNALLALALRGLELIAFEDCINMNVARYIARAVIDDAVKYHSEDALALMYGTGSLDHGPEGP